MSGDQPNPSASGAPAFTPGPWMIYTGSDAENARKCGFVLVVAGSQSGRIVANVNAESCPDIHSAPAFVRMPVEANARLIAAAPDLLDALHKLAAEVVGLRAFESELRAELGNINWNALMLRLSEADAAIAKAEGRT